jgi:hypothetical protein
MFIPYMVFFPFQFSKLHKKVHSNIEKMPKKVKLEFNFMKIHLMCHVVAFELATCINLKFSKWMWEIFILFF